MPLPPDLTEILVDYWSFNQGSGSIVYGEHVGIPGVLRRFRMPCGCHPLVAETGWSQGHRDGSDNWVRTPVDFLIPDSGGCCCKPDDRIQLVRLESVWKVNQTTRVATSRRVLESSGGNVERNTPWTFTTRLSVTYSDATPPETEVVEPWQMGPWTCDDDSGDGIGGGMWQGNADPVTGFDPSALAHPHQFPGLWNTAATLITLPDPDEPTGTVSGGARLEFYEHQVGCDRFIVHCKYTFNGGDGASGGSSIETWLEFRLTPGTTELPAASGWYVENRASINATSGRWIYNGAMQVTLPTAIPFTADGSGCTIIVRFTRNWIPSEAVPCWAPSVDADPSLIPDTESDIITIGRRVGVAGGPPNLRLPRSIWLGKLREIAPTVGDPCCGLKLGQTPGGISGEVTDSDQAFVAPSISIAPHTFVLTIKRDESNPRAGEGYIGYCEAWVDGVKLNVTGGGTRLYVALAPVLKVFEVGDALDSFGAISDVSIFRRSFEDEEVLDVGEDGSADDLDGHLDDGSIGPGGGGGGKSHPWLNSDGSVRLIPTSCVASHAGVSISSDGPHGRQTRPVYETGPATGGGTRGRRYTLSFDQREGEMIAILREGLNAYRGGALNARWRHPKDDPPSSVAGAPRWKILNAIEVERSLGGVLGTTRLELEQV